MSEGIGARSPDPTVPLLVIAEFVFSEEGEREFERHLEQTMREVRSIEGCLHAAIWTRPNRRVQFATSWTDRQAVVRWVENEFHRRILMPGFRKWCTEGWFGEYRLDVDHPRAIRCAACGRWTQSGPGWSEVGPPLCQRCGATFPDRSVSP